MILSGWGRYPVLEGRTCAPRNLAALQDMCCANETFIARGNGRAYGDSAINRSATIEMKHFNRMIAFDSEAGQLTAEAGILLEDIISTFLPRGWFLMITPGTKFVTLGGAIAADVHGKNHHKDGSFRNCVDWVEVMGPDGTIMRCSREENATLFDHTLGGMGLTGIVLRTAIRLRRVESAWMRQTTIAAPSLEAAMSTFEATLDTTYSVAWIDCLAKGDKLGRSLVMLGEHTGADDLPGKAAKAPFDIKPKRKRVVPVDFPGFALNSHTIRAFNALYYKNGLRKAGEQLVDWNSFFFPLDAIQHWNRIYGRKGFVQFQCVLPLNRSEAGLRSLLETVAEAGLGSFLAVLKRFGPQDSAFSFPMEGYTLALDFPVNAKTLSLLERLDEITIDHGGRFYLAKDSRMNAATLRASDPRVDAFISHRNSHEFSNQLRSAQAERLEL